MTLVLWLIMNDGFSFDSSITCSELSRVSWVNLGYIAGDRRQNLKTENRSGTWAKRFYLWRSLSSCRAPLRVDPFVRGVCWPSCCSLLRTLPTWCYEQAGPSFTTNKQNNRRGGRADIGRYNWRRLNRWINESNTIREKNVYSPCCNEMSALCSRRHFLYSKGKLGSAHAASVDRVVVCPLRTLPTWQCRVNPIGLTSG